MPKADTPVFNRVALIGLGLIASSMAHAMRWKGLAGEITGHARSAETRATAMEIGLVDQVFETAAEAVKGADLVVLCVPVGVMGGDCRRDCAASASGRDPHRCGLCQTGSDLRGRALSS